MIVGYHKSDKIRQVPTSEGKRYSEYYKCAFKEVRQDDPVGVEECIRDMLAEEYGLIGAQLWVSDTFSALLIIVRGRSLTKVRRGDD